MTAYIVDRFALKNAVNELFRESGLARVDNRRPFMTASHSSLRCESTDAIDDEPPMELCKVTCNVSIEKAHNINIALAVRSQRSIILRQRSLEDAAVRV